MTQNPSEYSAQSDTLAADFEAYLSPSQMVNCDHPDIISFAESRSAGRLGDVAKSVAVYYAVRDELRYDPYTIDMSVPGFAANNTLASGRGWCVSKAVVLAAACRALGIPARLGFADVKNHLSTANLRESMGTDIFYWHGYTDIYLNDQWVKATPAFNIELCDKFRMKSLEFDGASDSIYHPFDMDGRQHMEYLNFRGHYADVPIAEMKADMAKYYPNFSFEAPDRDFDSEVELETS